MEYYHELGPKKDAGETLLALGGTGILFLCVADRDADPATGIYWVAACLKPYIRSLTPKSLLQVDFLLFNLFAGC